MTRHAKVVIDITCEAPEGHFDPILPIESARELEENGPIPCEGSGAAEWCQGCRFCSYFFTEVDDPIKS